MPFADVLTETTSDMSLQYQYVRIRGKYFGLQKNPLVLIWLLSFTNDPLWLKPAALIRFLFLYLTVRSFQISSYVFGKKTVKNIIRRFIRQSLYLWVKNTLLELPVYGNVCLPVRGGYKVFDFRRRAVVKIFALGVDTTTVIQEIEKVQNASSFNFAPTVRCWNVRERWYEEDYYTAGNIGWSIPRLSSVESLNLFYKHVIPCIEQMILLQTSSIDMPEYVNKTTEVSEKNKLLAQDEQNQRKVHQIRSFTKSIAKQLYLKKSRINLAFSHGDFCLLNILRKKDKIIVIDWAEAGHRSILHDFYNYFFCELYFENTDIKTLISQVNNALSYLQLRLSTKAPDIAKTLMPLAQVYRKMYYFERACMLVESELTDRRLNTILRLVNIFNRYEEEVGSSSNSHFEG